MIYISRYARAKTWHAFSIATCLALLMMVLLGGCTIPPATIPQDGDAMWNLGIAYDLGKGVAKDGKEAVKWYRKAAELGHTEAMRSLGMSYDNGIGVIEDDKEAVNWFRKAVELGNELAMVNLGVMYALGRGVIQDHVEAYAWFNVAAANSDKYKIAAQNRVMVKKRGKMTPEQIAEGQKRSREIMNSISKE